MKAGYFAFCAIVMTGAWPACAVTSEITVTQRALDVKQKALYGSEDQAYADGRDFSEIEIPNVTTTKDARSIFIYTRWIAKEFLKDITDSKEKDIQKQYTQNGTMDAIEGMLHYVLFGGISNPSQDELTKAYWISEDLRAKGKVGWDDEHLLPANAAGAYTYKPGVAEADDDTVGIYFNKQVRQSVCKEIGDRPCAAILAHEACHAKARRDGFLDPSNVIMNEVYAFQCEYAYLAMAYPDPKEFSWLEYEVVDLPRLVPNAKHYSEFTVNFMIHLGKLMMTGGDPDRVRQFVEETGYRDPQPT